MAGGPGAKEAAAVIIPARYASTRLPGKPLADIAGTPMIVHVWRRAVAANAGDVVVATDSGEIADAVTAAGGRAIMTRADHASVSDRVFEAVTKADPGRRAGIIVNLQGDLPTLDPDLVTRCLAPLSDPEVDIATLTAVITEPEERTNPNVVKVVSRSDGTKPSTASSRLSRASVRRCCESSTEQIKKKISVSWPLSLPNGMPWCVRPKANRGWAKMFPSGRRGCSRAAPLSSVVKRPSVRRATDPTSWHAPCAFRGASPSASS